MNLYFEPVTTANRATIEQIRTLPQQIDYIESVKDCMKEADELDLWRPVGIYDNDVLVGFAMYGYFSETEGRVWLDRILIDGTQQGKGYGKAAIVGLLKRLYLEYGKEQVYLSVYENNAAAIHLYQQLGFQFNGELDTLGEKVMVYSKKDVHHENQSK